MAIQLGRQRGHSVRSSHLHCVSQFLLNLRAVTPGSVNALPPSPSACLVPLHFSVVSPWPPEMWQGKVSGPSAVSLGPGHPKHCHPVPELSSVACRGKSPIWLHAGSPPPFPTQPPWVTYLFGLEIASSHSPQGASSCAIPACFLS